jgi:hypothetical protein
MTKVVKSKLGVCLWLQSYYIVFCQRSVEAVRTCALYASQDGTFCTFETRKDAQDHFGITYKKLVKLINCPGGTVNG